MDNCLPWEYTKKATDFSFGGCTVLKKPWFTLQPAGRNSYISPTDVFDILGMETASLVSCTLPYTDPFLHCLTAFQLRKQDGWRMHVKHKSSALRYVCMHGKSQALRLTLLSCLPLHSHDASKKSPTSWCSPFSRVFTPQSRHKELTRDGQAL